MLEKFDFNNFDENYSETKTSSLGERLACIQRECNSLKIPVLILIDGWESSGKGYVIKDLIRELDPKYYKVKMFQDETSEERMKLFSQEFWKNIPQKGDFAVYDRSLYHRILSDYNLNKNCLDSRIDEMNNMEKVLYDDGYIIVKFFLHVKKETQKENIKENMDDINRNFLVDENDLEQNLNYEKYLKHFDYLLKNTNSKENPWNIVSSENKKKASKYIIGKTIDELEKGIERILKTRKKGIDSRKYDKNPKYLEKIDLNQSVDKDKYENEIRDLQNKAAELAFILYKKKIPTVIVFEGMDAAGKGGGIKRLTREIDPRGYVVSTTSAPTEEELKYHYLWRFYKNIPHKGFMTIFDRSWYGRVLVERVENLATTNEWDRAFEEINNMEKEFSRFGMLIIKYFHYIDKNEQLERFEDREREKTYKITEEDWRNRDKWDSYIIATNEMLDRTSTNYAPWHVIESQDKRYSRIKILKIFIEKAEEFIRKGEKNE